MRITRVHHIAIICSDYARSKAFYVGILGCVIVNETYREARDSFKLDLTLSGEYVIELFSFPETPPRLTGPEACGLRHLAFEVPDVEEAVRDLQSAGVKAEPIRIDEITGKRFTFTRDPDDLPIEFYER